MHPSESGTLFGEPVVHLHGNRNKAPRFGVYPALSPLDFIDFVVRNRFADGWARRYPAMVDQMRKLHEEHTAQPGHYRIKEDAIYDQEVSRLDQMQSQRRTGLPVWKSPPTARRYPFPL